MFGRRLAGHSHHTEHPLRRRVLLTILGAALLAALFLLITPRSANGNFVYWTNDASPGSIGRAKINGTGANNNFIIGVSEPHGIAIDSKYIYWSQGDAMTGSIGRANLDGTGANPNFIPHSAGVNNPFGVAVTSNSLYWADDSAGIGRANLDGSAPDPNFISDPNFICGVAADQSFVYWLVTIPANRIGRAPLDGSVVDPNFIPGANANCGVAVDSGFIYWGTTTGSIGRAPIGGGTADNAFIPGASTGNPNGVAVNPQYIFWGNPAAMTIGRANINGSAPNPTLVAGASDPSLVAAAPSNKITVNSVTKKKKKGTAAINAKVPGPGQVTLNQTSAPPDVNAVEAGVKQVGLTITQASSFKLAVKPTGKTARKLNKQIKKQLKKKRKAKAKASVTVFIHFVPAGVAGVPNTEQRKITLIKQRKKKK